MSNYDVYGIGNALVDTEYEVDDAFLPLTKLDKGLMTLIDEQQRAELIYLLETEHEHQVVKLAGGGSAANTIVIVAQLGGKAFYSCKVANDKTGDFFVDDLIKAGVMTNLGAQREAGVTGECISMVSQDAERTMATHLGITQNFSVNELRQNEIENSKFLYIEGYLVSSPTGFEAALKAQAIAKAAGVQVSLTLSDPAMVENFKTQFDQIISAGVDLLFCNEDEAMLFSGTSNREQAATTIGEVCTTFAITCGKDGALINDGEHTELINGVVTTPVDTTGAGDIFAGAFLYALCQQQSFAAAADLANQSASKLISNFGARLSAEEAKLLIS